MLARRLMPLVLILLSGCGHGYSSTDPEATLCDFDIQRPASQRLGHILPSGQALPGEIDVEVFRASSSDIASVMARPQNDRVVKEYRKDCYNEQGKYWYPCVERVEIDLSAIRGLARAADLDQAANFAINMCQRNTRAAVPDQTGLQIEDADLYCVVSRRETCALPDSQ